MVANIGTGLGHSRRLRDWPGAQSQTSGLAWGTVANTNYEMHCSLDSEVPCGCPNISPRDRRVCTNVTPVRGCTFVAARGMPSDNLQGCRAGMDLQAWRLTRIEPESD